MTDDLEIQLKKALEECAQLRTENASLRLQFGIQPDAVDTNSDDKKSASAHNTLSIEKKISLFRSYFRGREDVYALRWEREGKKGYSPACSHDWDCPSCSHDRKAKRSRCENRKFYTLADQTIHDHLSGKTTIGIYPLLTDETCLFLAADFDKANWLEDVRSFISSCLDEVLALLKEHDIKPELVDERFSGKPITVKFKGELRDLQKKSVILVHRKQLMDQWKERLALFLDLPPKSIGEIGGGKSKATGIIDIATMQSLHRDGEVKPVVADYGQVIIDECHHVSAFSFEQVLKQVKAKYILGLTATPFRKDGHHSIITMQCGPIRFKATSKQQSELNQFEHVVLPRYTGFTLPETNQKFSIQEIYGLLVQDQNRMEQMT